MRRLVILAFAVTLAGCATATGTMRGYIGRPLQSAMATYGPPDFAFDMPDGRRAFQWLITTGFQAPTQTVVSANIYSPPGGLTTVTGQSTTYGGQRVEQSCRYTMYATWDGAAWIFESYEQPSFWCQ